MSARLIALVSLVVGSTAAFAQPKKDAKDAKKAPPPAPVTDPAAGPGDGSGSAATAPDEPPPKDMEGKDENPDNPKGTGTDTDPKAVVVPEKKKSAGYPTEETLRPITMPQNMSEISISPHAQISPYEGADALRARYGIVRQVQLGLTYVLGGIFHEPNGLSGGGGIGEGPIKFKPGKAVGLDLTVLIQDWVGVKVGVPVYIDPVAVSINVGIPMKFVLLDGKLAIGGLDDLFAIRVKRFVPSFYQEKENADYAFLFHNGTNPTTSRGYLKFSAYGIYQNDPKTAIVGRIGLIMDDFSGSTNASGHGGQTVFIRGGVDYAVRRWFDIGASIGWDDLSNLKTFAPQLYAAIRI